MTFLIIIGIVAFLLAIVNRTARKGPIYRDNDNAHLFSDDGDGFVQDKSINKVELQEEINRYYSANDFHTTKMKIMNYLKYYREDSFINLMLAISLTELQEFDEAEHYANNVLHKIDNNRTGYFLLAYNEYAKGNLKKSSDFMESALNNGLRPNVVRETIKDEKYISELFKRANVTE